jgi:hypothetical protein
METRIYDGAHQGSESMGYQGTLRASECYCRVSTQMPNCSCIRAEESSLPFPLSWASASHSLVFVHGLRGHRENTWAQGEGGRPWPGTLLPRIIQDSRVVTFGYDANPITWAGMVSVNTIGDHSGNLLSEVARLRPDPASVGSLSYRPQVSKCILLLRIPIPTHSKSDP